MFHCAGSWILFLGWTVCTCSWILLLGWTVCTCSWILLLGCTVCTCSWILLLGWTVCTWAYDLLGSTIGQVIQHNLWNSLLMSRRVEFMLMLNLYFYIVKLAKYEDIWVKLHYQECWSYWIFLFYFFFFLSIKP